MFCEIHAAFTSFLPHFFTVNSQLKQKKAQIIGLTVLHIKKWVNRIELVGLPSTMSLMMMMIMMLVVLAVDMSTASSPCGGVSHSLVVLGSSLGNGTGAQPRNAGRFRARNSTVPMEFVIYNACLWTTMLFLQGFRLPSNLISNVLFYGKEGKI